VKKVKPTAWALLVVSDLSQAESLPDQRAWAEETADRNGWMLTKVFSGVSSGKLGARPLTLQMIEELESLSPDELPGRLLMIRLERLGRGNGIEAILCIQRLRTLGVVIHTRIDGDLSLERASGLLLPVIQSFVGGIENEFRRDKLHTMYQNRRAAHETDPTVAVGMVPPYGLAYLKGHNEPRPPEDGAVRMAYKMKGEGYSNEAIARQLAAVAPPMRLKSGELKPLHWTRDRVRRLLIKPAYRGTIVDDATWNRAQPVGDITRPIQRFEYPLAGALHCQCGRPLGGHYSHSVHCRYYHCRYGANHNGRSRYHRADRLEAQFATLLGRLTADDRLLSDYAASQNRRHDVSLLDSQIRDLRQELAKIDRRRRTIFEAFEDETLPREELRWRLDDLKSQHAQLETRVEQAESARRLASAKSLRVDDLRRLLATANAAWTQASIDDRRALSKAIAHAFGGLVVDLDGTLHPGSHRP
jgi:hypothetical protein